MAPADLSEKALKRAAKLLRPEVRPAELDTQHGYIDLLDAELESPGPIQDLMLTRFVPTIYERYWRPFLGRLAKGVRGPSTADEHRIARLLLGLTAGATVLDIACGPGNFARGFARTVGPKGLVVGIDASPTMLARGVRDTRAQKVRNLAFVRGDAIDPPFKDRTFDAVNCFAALHLFADPFRALDRMRDVLKPGGRIAILTSVRARSSAFRAIESLTQRRGGVYVFGERELAEALTERGFTDIRQQSTGIAQFVGAKRVDSGA